MSRQHFSCQHWSKGHKQVPWRDINYEKETTFGHPRLFILSYRYLLPYHHGDIFCLLFCSYLHLTGSVVVFMYGWCSSWFWLLLFILEWFDIFSCYFALSKFWSSLFTPTLFQLQAGPRSHWLEITFKKPYQVLIILPPPLSWGTWGH